jgi:hypothetical protein
MMRFFDIETGPLPIEQIEAMIPEFNPADVKVGNIKDPAKIAEKIEEARAGHRQGFIDRAALSPLTGRVLAIGITTEEGQIECLAEEPHGSDQTIDDEAALLDAFWSEIGPPPGKVVRWAGFNIFGFDLPFLVKRSWILGVPVPPIRRGRYWADWLIDLREVWQLGDRQAAGSLDAIARAFRVGEKNGDGAMFAELLATKPEEALAYLRNDIEMTRKVAAVMGF